MTGPESTDGRQHLHGWPIHGYDELVAKLAASRQSQGITYAEMAHRMGDCYLQQVFNWLNGVECRSRRIFALANSLGYDLALVPRAEDGPPAALSAPVSAQQPSAQGVDGSGPETGTAGATDERAREDA